MITALEPLPDSASLERVAQALWEGEEPRGAALMVGAGLSRSALRMSDDAPLAPLWTDFADAMALRIYPNGGAPSDFLRLAQEYEAALGRPALNDLIRSKIHDEKLLPGPLHKRLVTLPWTDILTTNWDTLIERAAADDPDTFYSVVNTIDDIARTRSPRIVKLHGSFPSHLPFVFTEEDFRRYPTKFAPLVNLAQQVVMENALCLVGFSGDDPNFLQWTGWVRDHLGDNAPDIFLVGALSLSPSKRKMLESRRVRPIDFTPMLADVPDAERHARALELFVEALRTAKPWPKHRWPEPGRGKNHPHEEKKEKLIEFWAADRAAYPGWVVAAGQARRYLQHDHHDWREFQPTFAKLDDAGKRRALYEYGWRIDARLAPLPEHLRDAFASATADDASALPLAQRLEIARWLMRDARERGDGEAFARWDGMLEASGDAASKPWLAWDRCLRARDDLNLAELEKLLPTLVGDDPIWRMRKSALLAVLGREAEALAQAHDALRDLRVRRARDRKSIWVASRLSWALFVCQAANRFGDFEMPDEGLGDMDADRWPSALTQMHCDPWEERRAIDEALDRFTRRQRGDIEVRYQFDPGRATHSRGFPSDERPEEPVLARRFFDAVGVPRAIGYVNLIGDALDVAAEIDGLETYADIVRLAGLRVKEERLDEIINRLTVSRLDQGAVEKAADRLMGALEERVARWARVPSPEEDHWREAQAWSGQASRVAEVLSRLAVRLPPEQVRKMLALAFDLAKQKRPRDWTFYKPLAHVLHRGLKALRRGERAEFLLDAIELPLPGESVAVLKEDDWPELIFDFTAPQIDRNTRERRWGRRIEEVIDIASSGGALARPRAIQRLSQLHRWNILTPQESAAFGTALWSKLEQGGAMPADTGLYDHIMLVMPEPAPGMAKSAFVQDVFTLKDDKLPNRKQLVAAYNMARHLPRPPGFDMAPETAKLWLARLSTWRRRRVGEKASDWDYGDFHAQEYDNALGWALAGAVLPVLQREDVTDETVKGLFHEDAAVTVVRAIPALVRLRPDLKNRASDALRRAFARPDDLSWTAAADAVWEWRKIEGVEAPADLYGEVASAVLSRHPKSLISALTLASFLVERGRFGEADLSKLQHGLTYLLTELDYESDGAGEIVHLSLARVGAARLAAALDSAGRTAPVIRQWLDAAQSDPLPEVRYFNDREVEEEDG